LANNTGFLLMAGLGALLFLGRGGTTKTPDDDPLLVTGQRGGGPMPPAFDLQSYVDSLFGEMATVPVEPAMQFFTPRSVVVTSSGVPSVSTVAPEIITPTTKVQIGGDGGETITASALAVRRSEQIAQQEFEAAANVFAPPPGETAERNRIEEERQMKYARDLIAKNIAAQLARNLAVVERTRIQQENIARGLNPDGSAKTLGPGMSVIVAGQPIVVFGQDEFADPDFDQGSFVSTPVSAPQYSETFVISGGMDSPGFASEDEQPYQSVTTVHELTAAYDIGF